MNVFSFCLYGGAPKYVKGMFENIKLIQEYYPTWKVYIYWNSVEELTLTQLRSFSNVVLVPSEYTGNQTMLDRFKPIDDPSVESMFVRDADSRIHERDRWCIDKFMKSPKLFHVVRDHPFHVTVILGGLWGIKRGCIKQPMNELIKAYQSMNENKQGFDQHFLQNVIYPLVRDKTLIHGIVRMTPQETVIPIPMKTPHLFCGQVIEYNPDGTTYHNCEDCSILSGEHK